MIRQTLVATALLTLVTMVMEPNTQAADGWSPLFDGKTLDGWKQLGGKAEYSVEDGVIVGTAVPGTPNSFLSTEKNYGDFILEVDFKVDPTLNSGIQIRSNTTTDHREAKKKRVTERVFGYQVEIDPGDRAWSGGIYDEARRGWLNSLEDNRAARYAIKPNDWNQYRIQAIGDSIKTWLNGVPAADLVDSMTLSGLIGLQVHGVGDRPGGDQVRWRNIRIKDLGTSVWKPLFDGKTLSGWKPIGGGQWTVEDGVVYGKSPASEQKHGILLSDRKFTDFTIRVVYRAKLGNSGLYFRCETTDAFYIVKGFQAEIDPTHDAGGLYETAGRAWVVKPTPEDVARYYKPDDWNEMTVSAHGGRIVVHVNGTKTAELKDDPGRTEGYLGLQLHGGQDMDVEFKSIEMLETAAERSIDFPPTEPADAAKTPIVLEGAKVELLATGFKFTEGPAVGPDGSIYFSDIPNERINRYDLASKTVSVFRENSGRANGLMFTPAGALYACEGGNRQLTRQLGDEITVLADQFEGKKFNSPNDLDIDGKGGVYFTDPRYGNRDDMEMEFEAVYYLPRRGKLLRVIDNLERPNGVVLSLDNKTLYVVDNGAKTIWAYVVQQDGSVIDGRKLADMDLDAPGGGDGMTIDSLGNIYCAGQGHVWVWNPKGELVTKIPVPESPANCTFGGPDKKTLFMTARENLYAIPMNVAGR